MWPNPQETAHLATFTEETLHGKLHFLCSELKEGSELKESYYAGKFKHYYLSFSLAFDFIVARKK